MAGGPHASRAAIASGQLDQLRSLVAELFPGNTFYSQKLNALGVTFDIASLADFSRRFPFTAKSELVADQSTHPPFGANLTYPLDRYTRFHQTSGTTGTTPPLAGHARELGGDARELGRSRSGGRHEPRGPRLLRVFLRAVNRFLDVVLSRRAPGRALCLPGGGMSSAARLHAILENGATVLCCTPTYAARLAEVAAEEQIDLRRGQVKTIIVAGEPGGSIPAIRARLEQLWPGARVFDHHGMTEVGPVSYECPARPGVLHVIESAYYAEVVDPVSSQPVAAYQPGELILTTLNRTGSPLLRYRTGDLVRTDPQPCPCGRHEMALEGGILGRTDDMIVVRGVNIYPGAVEEIVRATEGVLEYQVQVSSASQALTELTLRIEPKPGCDDIPHLVSHLEKTFQTHFALRVPVVAVPPGTLPRFEMKAKRWIRI